MSALDMLEDGFPHGTVDGYTAGCRTNHCPAPIRCAVFKRRYDSDYGFRKRVDAGWTVEQIAAADAEAAAVALAAERAARDAQRQAERRTRQAENSRAHRARKPGSGGAGKAWRPEELEQIRTMHAAGDSDADIAKALGRPVTSTRDRRDGLGLPRNPKRRVIRHGTRGGYDMGCRDDSCPVTPSCGTEGRTYYRELSAKHRRLRGEPVHSDRMTCRRGHELTPDNVFVKNDGRRRCATCRDMQNAAWNEKRRAAA